jgi:hypothetical protein
MKRSIMIAVALLACIALVSAAYAESLETLTLRQGDVKIVEVANGGRISGIQGAIDMGGAPSSIPMFNKANPGTPY